MGGGLTLLRELVYSNLDLENENENRFRNVNIYKYMRILVGWFFTVY